VPQAELGALPFDLLEWWVVKVFTSHVTRHTLLRIGRRAMHDHSIVLRSSNASSSSNAGSSNASSSSSSSSGEVFVDIISCGDAEPR